MAPFVEAATLAKSLGLGINAGHDLNLDNLHYLWQQIPWLKRSPSDTHLSVMLSTWDSKKQ